MTRKEQILQAARDYVSGVTLSSPSDVIHFEYGARWADEHPINVWHDLSEEPKEDGWILVKFTADIYDTLLMPRDKDLWDCYVKGCYGVSWAYISDLLAKGCKK